MQFQLRKALRLCDSEREAAGPHPSRRSPPPPSAQSTYRVTLRGVPPGPAV